mgnify:CR=1 FL=1
MSDNFYTLDPIDQQVALAYAQTLFANWLKNNPPGRTSGVPAPSAFAEFLDGGVTVAANIRNSRS